MDKTFSFSNRHIDLMQRDAKTLFGWRYDPPLVFDRGKGVFITDVDGNDYYDLTAGMMCMVLGHSHPELTETIREQAELLVHESSWYSNPWAIEFAELITSTLPGNLKVVNFAVTGSEANEIAMRMAVATTRKHDIVSVLRGLHGGSLAAEAVTSVGGERKGGLGPFMIPARSNAILAPFCYRCPVNLTYPSCDIGCLKLSEDMMEHMTSKSVAGIIAESILVPGGMIVPPAEWLPRLKKVAEDWGSLLILDEAQLAPGRTGKLWAFEHYDVLPDIVTFAKGMSAGLAICGTVTTPEIAEACRGQAGLPWSGNYPADPFPSAVALKNLQIVLRDRLSERAEKLGEVLRARLEPLVEKFECIGDVRGKGLYRMLDIVQDKKSKRPDYAMAERIRYNAVLEGVVTICVKNYMRLAPPLIITEAEIDDVVGRLSTAIQRAVDGYPKDIDFTKSSSLAASRDMRRPAAE
jgi:4-aminobutyrate aminotransferase-like enzyme